MSARIETPEAMADRLCGRAEDKCAKLPSAESVLHIQTTVANIVRARDMRIGEALIAIFNSTDTDNPGDIEARIRDFAADLVGGT